MNSRKFFLFLTFLVSLAAFPAWAESGKNDNSTDDPRAERVWTDRLGREVTATWDWEQEQVLRELQADGGMDYPLPMIRSADDKAFALPLEKLSEADRERVLDYRKSQASAEDDPFAGSPIPDGKSKKKGAKTSPSKPVKTASKSRLPKVKAGESLTRTIHDVEFRFRYCPAGILMVPNGRQIAKFRVKEGFWMLETEVTQAQWNAVMGENPAHFSSDTARPVEQVNWFDANVFCAKISKELGTEAGLPTALAWTWAACAGEPITTVERNALSCGWLKANSDGKTHAASQLTPNAWGLCDMFGNVWEWCLECRDSRKQPVLPGTPERKETSALHCGGSWYCDTPQLGKETWRDADQKIFDVGFRFCVGDEIRQAEE